MKSFGNGAGLLVVFCVGLMTLFFGVTKPGLAFGDTIGKDHVYFGKKENPVDVYIFTDWFCPACRRVESVIEQKAPEISKQARLFFIDIPIHEESANYMPYNLSFMLKEKGKYLKLRRKLEELSLREKAPTDEEIEKLAEAVGTRYQPLDYSDVNLGRGYFEEVTKKFDVDSTPTIVIVNPSTNKQKKLSGVNEIMQADFPTLIKSLQN